MTIYNFQADDARRFAMEQGARTRESGDELQFKICPYCRSSKDQYKFAINLKTGQFHCLRASCGVKGNMITLHKDFGFSLGQEADRYYDGEKKYRDLGKARKIEVKPAAIRYMQSRGISEAVTKRYGITTQKANENILVFPFMDTGGSLRFVKYRKTDFDKTKDNAKEWCERNCMPILFGMSQCNLQNKTLIMTEGQIDSLSVAEAGFENAVSVPTGKNGFTWVPHCWDFLQNFETLIVFGDHERGEITLLSDMEQRFHGTVKHVRPEDYRDCKDANELLQKYGPDAVKAAVNNAEPSPIREVISLDKVKRESVRDGTYQKSAPGARQDARRLLHGAVDPADRRARGRQIDTCFSVRHGGLGTGLLSILLFGRADGLVFQSMVRLPVCRSAPHQRHQEQLRRRKLQR